MTPSNVELEARVITDSDVRFFAISMIHAETERDRQTQLGASAISNPCDNCLAAEFAGANRVSEFAERPYMGRDLGTLIDDGLTARTHIAEKLYPGVLMQRRTSCAFIPGYGEIPGHYDVKPTLWHILDWKGSLRYRIAMLEDLMQERSDYRKGLAPRWKQAKDTKAYKGGFKFEADQHTTVSFSYNQFQEEMRAMAHKYLWYYGQQNLYMHGEDAKRASLIFIARDGTGYFDNPEYSGYDDLERKHDIFVLSFSYDEAFTKALIQRATDIVAALHAGADLEQFEQHPDCTYCKDARERAKRLVSIQFDGLEQEGRDLAHQPIGVDIPSAEGFVPELVQPAPVLIAA